MNRPITAALVSCHGTTLSSKEKKLLSQNNPLGVVLFNRNIDTPQQLQTLIKEIKETVGRDDIIIAVDQEGGRVRRLKEPDFKSTTHAITIGRLPKEQAHLAAKLHAQLISSDLRKTGINLNFAPVLDLCHSGTAAVLKSRCLSSSELVVAALGKTMVDEYINNSICPCIKHLPGHGRASVDPHLELPYIKETLDELATDFYPFQQLKNAPAGMTAHIIIDAIDSQYPITQSRKAIKTLIRGLIGFQGFLFSDSIDMHALKGTLADKILLSLDAGCDSICYTLGQTDQLEEIFKICPPLTEQALERLQKITLIIQTVSPQPTDDDKIYEEYTNLTGSIEAYQDTYDATEVLNLLQHKGDK